MNEGDFTHRYEVPLTPLPEWKDLPEEERRARVQALVEEIEQEASLLYSLLNLP